MKEEKGKFLKTNLKKVDLNQTNDSLVGSSMTQEKADQLFLNFVYQDQVTHSKYEVSQLKNNRRTKTQSDDTPKKHLQKQELKNLNSQLKLLQTIKQNRNKELVSNKKTKGEDKDSKSKHQSLDPGKIQLQKMKRRMRKQVSSLNHLFLREYLYHRQSFTHALAQINQQSDSGLMDGKKILQLKNRIIKCILNKKQQSQIFTAQGFSKGKSQQKRKSLKKIEQIKIDNDFKGILEQVRKEIRTKVKMEGQFNLYRKSLPKFR